MSLSVGYAGQSSDPESLEMFDLHVQCMSGNGLLWRVSPATLGREVRQMASKHFASKAGAKLVLYHGTAALVLNQTLQEQGILSEAATLSCTYVPTNLYFAWCYVQGLYLIHI
jgi:hypothetical protein